MADTNLEDCALVWLDISINDSPENRSIQRQLRMIINQLHTFEKADECEDYIRSASCHDQIMIIVSGMSGRWLVPRIHSLEQVYSIYIYCMDRKTNEQWTKNFAKVHERASNEHREVLFSPV